MERVCQVFAMQATPGTTPAQFKEANMWLEQFQATTEAWQVADQLLAQPADGSTAVSTAAHIFAAQTLRSKIQYDWAELPAEAHAQLRMSLLAHILRFGQGPQPVLTQLALAVGVLSLHMEEWHATVVTDLISSLTNPPAEATAKLPCLLELLTVLPEEAENYKVGVLPRRRQNFRSVLTAHAPSVFTLLGQVCEQCQPQAGTPVGLLILEKMLRCVSSWLRRHAPPDEQLATLPLLPFAFQALASPPLFDAAADLVVEIIHHTTQVEPDGNPLQVATLSKVLEQVPRYDAAVAAEELDEAKAFCRLFAEAGEQHLRLLLQQPEQWALPVARAVLRGAQHPEPEVAEITFNFWYVLSEELAGGGRMLPEAQRPAARQLFAPVFLEVVDALRELVELPDDSETWTPDAQDDFKRFRYAVGDAIFDSCKVAGSVHVIAKLFATLQGKLPAFQADPNGNWRSVEGCIYCLRQSISANDPTFFAASGVAEFLQLLPSLPAVGSLQSTTIRTVGTYAAWLNRNPTLLPPLLTFVSNGLTSQTTTAAAAQAMKHLCEACAEHLAQEATMQQLLVVYHGTLALNLLPADRVDLITALAFCVSQMNVAHILPAMQAIAQPLVEKLTASLQSAASSAAEVAVVLEQLCALLRGVSPSHITDAELQAVGGHPSVLLLESVWDVLDAIFVRHGTSSNCMEKLCRCYKHTARTSGDFFRQLVPRLIPQVTKWFEQQPHSCFVYMCNVCLSAFGHGRRAAELLPLFAEAFRRMTLAAFQLLSVTSTLVDNPDVVDDLFELCGKVLRYQPQMLLESDMLSSTYQCGCAALHLQHREAGRSALRFFENLIDLAVRPERGSEPLPDASLAAIRQVVGTQGQQLVTALISAIAGALPPSRIRFVAPLLRQLIMVDPNMVRPWATTAVQTLPAETHADGALFVGAAFSAEALQPPESDSERPPERVRDEAMRTFVAAADAFGEACRRKKAAVS